MATENPVTLSVQPLSGEIEHESAPTPTPPPVSAVQRLDGPTIASSRLPKPGKRRVLIAWTNQLRQVCDEVLRVDDVRARGLHAHHAGAIMRVSNMPPLSLPPTEAALSSAEQAWADHIAATPMFLNAFGQQGWKIARVPLDRLVIVQPVIDAIHDQVPTSEEEVVKWCLPETSTLDYQASLAADSQPGSFHVILTARHPNQDFDVELVQGGTGGALLGLRPRPNHVSVIRLPNRYVVHNGHHRLAALADAGVAEVPVVILDPAAMGPLQDRPGFLPFALAAQHPRPPVISDFLDPDLTIEVDGRTVGKVHALRIVHTELPGIIQR
jgi:hypothetical protein